MSFQVNHHGGRTTDTHLIRDEIHKAAYRAGKSFELVASSHISDLRAALLLCKRMFDEDDGDYGRGAAFLEAENAVNALFKEDA